MFSDDLVNFAELDQSFYTHEDGKAEIFNGQLVGIGGWYNRAFEIFNDSNWDQLAPIPAGRQSPFGPGDATSLYFISTLVLKTGKSDRLFVFGKFTY